MANVLKFDTKTRTITYEGENLVTGLQTELMRYIGQGGKFCKLSARCGGYPTAMTISRVCSGDSNLPRFMTVMLIYRALGFTIRAVSE